jgi:methyl-accepting chemotaxis protein
MLISRKIWLLVGIAMATSAAVSTFGLYGVRYIDKNVAEIAGESVPALMLVSDMRANYLATIPLVYERAGTADADKGGELEKRMNDAHARLLTQLEEYSARTNEEQKAALTQAKFRLINFINRVKTLNGLAASGETQMAMMMVTRDVMPLHQELAKAFDELVKHNTANVSRVAESAESAYARTIAITLGAALAGVGVIGVIGFLLGRSITGPLGAMQGAISRTASELDFTERMKIASNDEIGHTLAAYNELLAKLRASFAEIQASSARMAEITAEVSATSTEIAENSQAQSDASSGMAAAIEELTVSISMVATQAKDASQQTQQSASKAEQGAEVILSTVTGIQTISDSVRQTSSRIDALQKDSQSISSVANMIKEIAEQTNLLALNAAIEAARAGEQGRGFAVVADEVRKLAERTTKSTQEISGLLAQMQGSAKQAVDSMAVAVREVETGVENAQLAGQSIGEIKDGSNAVVGVVGEISEAVREQSAASTSISQRIEQIAQMTERNSAAAENTAQAVRRMTEMSREIAAALALYKV